MDLRSRYIQKFARVPLHLNYKLLGYTALHYLPQVARAGRGVAFPPIDCSQLGRIYPPMTKLPDLTVLYTVLPSWDNRCSEPLFFFYWVGWGWSWWWKERLWQSYRHLLVIHSFLSRLRMVLVVEGTPLAELLPSVGHIFLYWVGWGWCWWWKESIWQSYPPSVGH